MLIQCTDAFTGHAARFEHQVQSSDLVAACFERRNVSRVQISEFGEEFPLQPISIQPIRDSALVLNEFLNAFLEKR